MNTPKEPYRSITDPAIQADGIMPGSVFAKDIPGNLVSALFPTLLMVRAWQRFLTRQPRWRRTLLIFRYGSTYAYRTHGQPRG
jgi:hypothetical protein